MRVPSFTFAALVSIPSLFAHGCWLEPEQSEALELPSQPLPLDGSPTAYGMLRVANELDFPALDLDVELDRQAATSIVVFRAGADARLGTADDRLVADIAQLDALYWLGEENLWTIQSYALLEGWVPAALPEGCDPALAQALAECRRFVAEALAGSADEATLVEGSWSCVEGSDAPSVAAGYFGAAGLAGYLEPALGYHALLCGEEDDPTPLCLLGAAGIASHALPECVAVEE